MTKIIIIIKEIIVLKDMSIREMEEKIVKMEDVIKRHSLATNELERIIDEKTMEITVLEESMTRLVCG